MMMIVTQTLKMYYCKRADLKRFSMPRSRSLKVSEVVRKVIQRLNQAKEGKPMRCQ